MSEMIALTKSVPVVADVDVLVVGAGIAGAAAAVAAGRRGARTMVVDRFGYPGGNMGPGMMGGAPNMEIPEAMGGKLAGIPGEFIKRCESYCKAPLLAHYFRDSQVISYVWTRMMQEAGVQFMLNTRAGDPIMEGTRVVGLCVENKSGTQAIRAGVVVDATGDADVAARAGAPMDGGANLFSPGTYWAMANVDIAQYWQAVYPAWTPPTVQEQRRRGPRYIRGDEEFSFAPAPEDVSWAEGMDRSISAPHPSLAQMAKSRAIGPLFPYYRPAWESGEYQFLQEVDGLGYIRADHGLFRAVSGIQYVTDPLRAGRYGIIGAMVGVWRNEAPTSGDTAVMTALEVKARTFIFETAQFVARRVPGFGKAYLHMIAPYFNSRGGRSVVSDRPVTRDDIRQHRRFADVVFQAVSPADSEGVHTFDFPYRQFLPGGVDGLLVTGRACLVQPPAMRVRWMVLHMGQAAGVAAAMAAAANVTPRALNTADLQKALYCDHQAPLGDADRLQGLGLV
jgi:hypothetical protein